MRYFLSLQAYQIEVFLSRSKFRLFKVSSLGVGRTDRQLVYDLSFVNIDKLDIVQTG